MHAIIINKSICEIGMIQRVEMTHKMKVKMYSKYKKKKLIKMLIACNDAIDAMGMKVEYTPIQKCPTCGGTGQFNDLNYSTTGLDTLCPTCQGHRTIPMIRQTNK